VRFAQGFAVALLIAAGAGLPAASLLAAGLPARAADAGAQPDPELASLAREALAAAEDERWVHVHAAVARTTDPLLKDLLLWLEFSDEHPQPSFAPLSRFIDTHPDWPRLRVLRTKAERALVAERIGDSTALAWLTKHPPVSRDGRIRLAQIFENNARPVEAAELFRRVWVEENFTAAEAKAYYRAHKKVLRAEHHVTRLDRLLWDGLTDAARRMVPYVDAAHAKLSEARLSLIEQSGGVDGAIAAVPAALRNDPGLVFDRISWRRKKGLDAEARALLFEAPAPRVRPDLWWHERAVQIRNALDDGAPRDAYRLAAGSGLEPGADRADAEWLAGWIALAYLGKPETAAQHFARMREMVSLPISVARASYWAGRALEKMGQAEAATARYREAAQHWHTYYGQLAAIALHEVGIRTWPQAPAPAAGGGTSLAQHPLLSLARILIAAEADDEVLEPFFMRLIELSQGEADAAFLARVALEAGRPQLSVKLAKEAAKRGHILLAYAYPVVPLPVERAAAHAEEPLLRALMRQESSFDSAAESRAGALGLMQLMPATAKKVAKGLGLPASSERLTSDPAYNILLGSAYLGGLIDDYHGSYVLALAAYNAGPGKVARWIARYGDPRQPDVDAIDWIERIPFGETRNYIQRVLEGLQVYRLLLGDTQPVPRLVQDLNRTTRTSRAASS